MATQFFLKGDQGWTNFQARSQKIYQDYSPRIILGDGRVPIGSFNLDLTTFLEEFIAYRNPETLREFQVSEPFKYVLSSEFLEIYINNIIEIIEKNPKINVGYPHNAGGIGIWKPFNYIF